MLVTRAIIRHSNCTYMPIPAAMRDALGLRKGSQVVIDMPRPGELRVRNLADLLRTPEEVAAAQARRLDTGANDANPDQHQEANQA